jgi:hypothetical protein
MDWLIATSRVYEFVKAADFAFVRRALAKEGHLVLPDGQEADGPPDVPAARPSFTGSRG